MCDSENRDKKWKKREGESCGGKRRKECMIESVAYPVLDIGSVTADHHEQRGRWEREEEEKNRRSRFRSRSPIPSTVQPRYRVIGMVACEADQDKMKKRKGREGGKERLSSHSLLRSRVGDDSHASLYQSERSEQEGRSGKGLEKQKSETKTMKMGQHFGGERKEEVRGSTSAVDSDSVLVSSLPVPFVLLASSPNPPSRRRSALVCCRSHF